VSASRPSSRLPAIFGLIVALSSCKVFGDPASPSTLPSLMDRITLPASAAIINGRNPLPRSGEIFGSDSGKRTSDQSHSRGITATNVYPKVAPAVVVVDLPDGHGTGFIVDPEGWIITNNHVAIHAEPDPSTGVRTADILFGQLVDGWMKPLDHTVQAQVYKLDPDKDLALLKVMSLPDEIRTMPYVPLADHLPPPGSECVAIGHPATSALWTVRTGELTGTALWPDEEPDVVLQRISLSASDLSRFTSELKSAPKRYVLYSDTGINVGDSGGPLVNDQGQVIGVTFAMPAFNPDQLGRQGTTSFHVRLDEVQRFLRDKPSDPMMEWDPWPSELIAGFADIAGTGTSDTLIFAPDRQSRPTALLVDLDGASDRGLTVDQMNDPSQRSRWHFQFAIHAGPNGSIHRTFYDTSDSGRIDLILTALNGDDHCDVAVRLGPDGQWHLDPSKGGPMIDPNLITDEGLRQRLVKYCAAMSRTH